MFVVGGEEGKKGPLFTLKFRLWIYSKGGPLS
jgi:hypothetical protein